MTFKKVETEFWDEKEKSKIRGVLISVQTEAGQYKSILYTLETEPGKTIGVWGSKVLNDKMAVIKEGDLIEIEFLGEVKGEKSTYKTYEVYLDDGS